MSNQNSSGAGAQSGNQQCSTCGTVFDSPQGLGGHLSGGSCPKDSSAREDPTPSEVEDFSDEAAQSIIDRLDYEGKDSDSLQTVAAKALIDEGDTEGFVEAFGECADPQCNWGSNGFDASYCIKHQDSESPDEQSSNNQSPEETDSEDSSSSEPGSAELNRFELGMKLTEAGLSIEDAEKAVEVVEDYLG